MERFTEASELRHRRLMRRVLVASGVLLALLIVTLMLQSCGGERAAVESTTEPTAATPAGSTPAAAYAVPAALVAPASPEPASPSTGESLPPEIALRDPVSSVLPGQAITVTVDGTPDVTQMTLSDGINDPQALVRDASGDGSWEVGYRVPLKPKSDRIGLSVTARNAEGRWRRVWVFLQVVKPEPVLEVSAPDTLDQR